MPGSKSRPQRPHADKTILIHVRLPSRLCRFVSLRHAALALLAFMIFHPLSLGHLKAAVGMEAAHPRPASHVLEGGHAASASRPAREGAGSSEDDSRAQTVYLLLLALAVPSTGPSTSQRRSAGKTK